MRLTVLGAYGSFPGPDGACSGYLLQEGNLRLLLDCGNGVLSRLQRYCRVEELERIVISHLHFDHMADLLVLQYGLGTQKAIEACFQPLPLHLPATPEEVDKLLRHEDVFAKTYVEDGMLAQVGPLALSYARMEHPVECYAVTVQAGGRKLVYSSDTVYHPGLVEAAEGADLFLCEATGLQGAPAPAGFPHLTARQAAEAAAQAGVARLLLTHYWHETPKEGYLAEARAAFAAVEMAEELVTYEV